LLLLVFALGMTPSVFLHVRRFLEFGTPIYPFQFKFLGIETETGRVLRWDQGDLWHGFVRGWLWPDESLPLFFDSRLLAVGFFFWIALITFPVICRTFNRRLTFTLALFIAISLIVQDFMSPRYAMSLVLAVVLIVGGALAFFAAQGPRWAYAALLVATVLHLFGRPVYVGAGISMFDKFYYRANLSGSPWFIMSTAEPEKTPTEIYPDWGADLLIVYPVRNQFVLPLYGKNLSNRIIGKVDPTSVGEPCAGLRSVAEETQRKLLVVDQTGRLTGKCSWICEMPRPWGCMAQRLRPGGSGQVAR
jgi:hypothetical protein